MTFAYDFLLANRMSKLKALQKGLTFVVVWVQSARFFLFIRIYKSHNFEKELGSHTHKFYCTEQVCCHGQMLENPCRRSACKSLGTHAETWPSRRILKLWCSRLRCCTPKKRVRISGMHCPLCPLLAWFRPQLHFSFALNRGIENCSTFKDKEDLLFVSISFND